MQKCNKKVDIFVWRFFFSRFLPKSRAFWGYKNLVTLVKFVSFPRFQFSLHEALWQCQALFSEVTGKVARRCVTLLTCVDEPHKGEAGKERQAMQKAGDLVRKRVFLLNYRSFYLVLRCEITFGRTYFLKKLTAHIWQNVFLKEIDSKTS